MRKIPSITALQALEATARLGSFTLAAEELHLTQSAVSRQIRGLEELLGVRLFELIRQRIVLTQMGRTYADEIRPIIASLEAASVRAMASAQGVQLIELATLPTLCCRWLIPRLPKYYDEHPEVSISMTSKFMPFSFDAEPFDLAIHFGKPDWPGAELLHLFDERMVATCSPTFRERYNIQSDADVIAAPLLHHDLRQSAWVEWRKRSGLDSDNLYRGKRYDQWSMEIEAAIAGLGIALLPEFFIEDELQSGRLVIASETVIHSADGYYIAVPENKPKTTVITEFCDWMLEEAGKTTTYIALPSAAEQ